MVGAYGVVDVEGSPGELELLLDDNRTVLIEEEMWQPIAAVMRTAPIKIEIKITGNRVEAVQVVEAEDELV